MRHRKAPRVLGLDLSLRATAAVLLPEDWDPASPDRWDVPSAVFGYSLEKATPREELERLAEIAQGVAVFAVNHRITHAYVEGAAYGLSARSGVRLAELAGAVKVVLFDLTDVVAVPVSSTTVRKFFLGKLPRKGAAEATHARLKELGCPWEGSDRGDAILLASYGRSGLGLPGLVCG